MFQTDPALSAIGRNVQITVVQGKATMTGTVLTEHDRRALHQAVAGVPGLHRVIDRTEVD